MYRERERCVYTYLYIYIYRTQDSQSCGTPAELGRRYLSNATCPVRLHLSSTAVLV